MCSGYLAVEDTCCPAQGRLWAWFTHDLRDAGRRVEKSHEILSVFTAKSLLQSRTRALPGGWHWEWQQNKPACDPWVAGWAQRWIPGLEAWLCFGLSSWHHSLCTILHTLISRYWRVPPCETLSWPHLVLWVGKWLNRSARGSLWKWFSPLLEIARCRLTTRRDNLCGKSSPRCPDLFLSNPLGLSRDNLRIRKRRNPLFSMSFFPPSLFVSPYFWSVRIMGLERWLCGYELLR